MRRTLFLKFLALTLAIGAVIGAVIMVIHAGQRRDQMMGELSAEVATLATRLARPLAAEAGENPVRARDLLGVFAGLPYDLRRLLPDRRRPVLAANWLRADAGGRIS